MHGGLSTGRGRRQDSSGVGGRAGSMGCTHRRLEPSSPSRVDSGKRSGRYLPGLLKGPCRNRPANPGARSRTNCREPILGQFQRCHFRQVRGGGVARMADEPHVQRRGRLKNDNPAGDFSAARRCGAMTRRQTPCGQPAMWNRRRCRLHGGKSTGPRTPAGLERSRRARWKHGVYSRETRAMLRSGAPRISSRRRGSADSRCQPSLDSTSQQITMIASVVGGCVHDWA
jgi:hypothetical protein